MLYVHIPVGQSGPRGAVVLQAAAEPPALIPCHLHAQWHWTSSVDGKIKQRVEQRMGQRERQKGKG